MTLSSIESMLAPLRYVDKARVSRDVLGLIRNSNSLQIKVQPFVHPNGTSDTLLSLTGTTPIYYKNACYNIPVTIWLGEQYPHRPPGCFVTPTRDMRIKDGHLHVDHNGVIYLPYLNQWNPQSSNLLEMVTIMSSVFSQDPPVFKVPTTVANPPAAAAAAGIQQQQPQPSMQPNNLQQPPQQPISASFKQATPPAAQIHNPYAVSQPQQPQQQQQQQNGNSSVSPSHANSQQSNYSQSSSSSVLTPSPLPPLDPRAARKNQLIAQLTLKLRQHLSDELSLKTLLMDDLMQSQQQVGTHGATVEESIAANTAELAQVQYAQRTLQSQNDELARWLEQHEKRELPDIDRLCYVKDTWSKQLLDAVSLDLALEDAYYLLDRSLQDDRIDLQSYTKQIRALSRKQFLARSLVAQIQQQQQLQQQQPSVAAQQPAANHIAQAQQYAQAQQQQQQQQSPQSQQQPQYQQQPPQAQRSQFAPQLQVGPPVVMAGGYMML